MVLYAIILPFIIVTLSTFSAAAINMEYLFMILVVGAGVLTGLQFPLVSKILIKRGGVGTLPDGLIPMIIWVRLVVPS